MTTRITEADCSRILIVEGHSDFMFCQSFLKHLGRLEGVYFHQFGGKSNILKRQLLADYLTPQRLATKDAIGILLDADDNPTGAIQSLRASLQAITDRELTEGAWTDGPPKLGFFVAPDGVSCGELETLVWNAWSSNPDHKVGKESVLTYLTTMEQTNAKWKAKSPDKARIGAFLAAAYDEDPRLGPGAREGLFDFDDPSFVRLKNFLIGL